MKYQRRIGTLHLNIGAGSMGMGISFVGRSTSVNLIPRQAVTSDSECEQNSYQVITTLSIANLVFTKSNDQLGPLRPSCHGIWLCKSQDQSASEPSNLLTINVALLEIIQSSSEALRSKARWNALHRILLHTHALSICLSSHSKVLVITEINS